MVNATTKDERDLGERRRERPATWLKQVETVGDGGT